MRRSLFPKLFCSVLALSLTVSALSFFLFTWRWPLVGDASLIHYIAFLIQRGWIPYAQLGDMNMPGSYLIELATMHTFGPGALAWRLFDFTLLAIASAAFFIVTTNLGAPSLSPQATGWEQYPTAPGAPSSPTVSSSAKVGSNYLPGLFASSLFILIHGRDGLAEGGQRDLTMAVLLLAATAFLFGAVRRRAVWPIALFGLLSGIAATIKPTSLPLTALQLALALYAFHSIKPVILSEAPEPVEGAESKGLRLSLLLLTAILAYLLAPAIALIFLLREHALAAFLAGFHGIVPYYASLGHRPLGFVLLHSLSPLLPLVLAWLFVLVLQPALLALRPASIRWERNALLAGVLFGLVNCIVQQRALPYYRYPLLVFLLPLLALDFTRCATTPGAPSKLRLGGSAATESGAPHLEEMWKKDSARGWGSSCSQILATLALAFGGFFLAPQSAVLIHRYQWWNTDFIATLQQNLNALGGPALSGRIQCIDSISGCGNVLYRMRLEPATGVLSDFLLFGQPKEDPESVPIIRQSRAGFLAAVVAHPPQVIVVTSHLHIDGPDNFQKLARWPAFAAFLASRYTLRTEWRPTRNARWWSREETPASYRIYVLHP